MKTLKNKCCLFFLLVINCFMSVFAQNQSAEFAAIVSGLRSQDRETIETAYFKLVGDNMSVPVKYRNNREIKDALWSALKYLVPEPVVLTSEEKEESGIEEWLLAVMGDVKEKRAIPYLVKNISYGGCQPSLSRLGNEAVDPVLNVLKNGSENERIGALLTLESMVEIKPREIEMVNVGYDNSIVKKVASNSDYGDYVASGTVRSKIKVALKNQMGIKDSKIRLHVLNAFKHVAAEEDVSFLEEISKTDTSSERGRYYIRDTAQEILKEIKARNAERNRLNKLEKSTSTR